MQRVLLASLIVILASLAADALAQTGCTRTEIKRAVPGGDEVPAFRIDCEESPDEGLLAADASERVCGSPDLGPGEVAACEEAVHRAQAALRKAKLRAALRDGADEEELRKSYDASPAEIEGLRESALQTAPPEAPEE